MKHQACLLAVAGFCSAATAMPVVSNVSCAQDPVTKAVTVSYTLGNETNREPAIVTVDFQTNATGTAESPWVSIGAKHFRDLGGDVNRYVQPGDRTILWQPVKGWPNHAADADHFRATVQVWTKEDPPDYLVAFWEPRAFRFYTCEDALPGGIESDVYRSTAILLRRIHAAGVTWMQGSLVTEVGRSGALETPRAVTLSKDYYIGVFPFTLWQYCAANRMTVEYTNYAGSCPLNTWSWNHALYGSENKKSPNDKLWPEDKELQPNTVLSSMRNRTGLTFIYPTAAQWEYACRAGTTTPRFDGSDCPYVWDKRWDKDDDPAMNDYAWYTGNTTNGMIRVGLKKPNPWGLYDMYGLVYEFCLDWAEDNPSSDPVVDPEGPQTGSQRVFCGGAWNCGSPFLRSAVRTLFAPSARYATDYIFGFRVVAPVEFPDELP